MTNKQSSSEVINSIISDLNEMIKQQMTGQYISAFGIFEIIIRKLICLKDDIASDTSIKDNMIESLKHTISDMERKDVNENGAV